MANWYGTSRSNYFRVRDPEKFKELMEHFGVKVWIHDEDPTLFGLGSGDDFDGNWPSCDSDNMEEEIDFVDLVAQHLKDGEVAIFVSAGAEKMRYVTGYAIAIDNTGKNVSVNIDNIYDMVKAKFGIYPTLAEY